MYPFQEKKAVRKSFVEYINKSSLFYAYNWMWQTCCG